MGGVIKSLLQDMATNRDIEMIVVILIDSCLFIVVWIKSLTIKIDEYLLIAK